MWHNVCEIYSDNKDKGTLDITKEKERYLVEIKFNSNGWTSVTCYYNEVLMIIDDFKKRNNIVIEKKASAFEILLFKYEDIKDIKIRRIEK